MEWDQDAFPSSSHLNPLEYGHKLEDSLLEPIIVNVKNIIPDDFPVPCSCVNCFRDRSCHCLFGSRSCSQFHGLLISQNDTCLAGTDNRYRHVPFHREHHSRWGLNMMLVVHA